MKNPTHLKAGSWWAFRRTCPHGLTEMQSKVMHLLGNGMMGKEIAHLLGISIRTCEIHTAAVYKALDVSSSLKFGLWYGRAYPLGGQAADPPRFAGWIYATPSAKADALAVASQLLRELGLLIISGEKENDGG